jgi:hypothetical protein
MLYCFHSGMNMLLIMADVSLSMQYYIKMSRPHSNSYVLRLLIVWMYSQAMTTFVNELQLVAF